MKKIFLIFLTILVSCTTIGCGGAKVIKGIEERERSLPELPARISINHRAYNHFVNGAIFEAMGELHMANKQYSEALKYYPNSDEIRYSYASTFMRLHDFQRALKEANRISPKDLRTWLLLANCYRALEVKDSSIVAFKKVVEFDSTNVQAYHILSAYYRESGNLDSAIWAYKNIAAVSPTSRAYLQLANLQVQAGQLDKAEENYRQSLALDSTGRNIRAFLGLSAIYEDKGDTDKARQYLESAALRAPQDILIKNRLFGFYQRDNEWDRAIEMAREIIDLAPNDRQVTRRLALIYFEVDSLRLADSIFTELLSQGDENIFDHYYSGRIALQNEDFAKAKTHFTRLTAVADSVADGWLNLGLVYRLQDSSALEIATYESGLQYMKNINDSAGILFALAVVYERQGEFDKSVELFEQLIALLPNHSRALNYLGYMYADKDIELEHARSLIERALEIMPENGAYIDSYGWVLFKIGELEKALEQLLRAYQYIDNDPVILQHIGDVYNALDNVENALQYWNRSLELDSSNQALREKLGR